MTAVPSPPFRLARVWDLRAQGLPIGRSRDGGCDLPADAGHLLITGDPRSGRSSVARNIAAAVALDPRAQLIVAAARPPGWGPINLTAHRFIAGADSGAFARLAALLDGAIGDINERLDQLHGPDWPDPLAPEPHVVIVIDDADTYLRNAAHGRGIATRLATIARTGRAAGYKLVLVAQGITGTDLRDQFEHRLTTTPTTRRRRRLGDPGCGLLVSTSHEAPVEVDVDAITDHELALLAERARTARAAAGTLPVRPVIDFDDPDTTLWVIDPKAGPDDPGELGALNLPIGPSGRPRVPSPSWAQVFRNFVQRRRNQDGRSAH